MMPIPIETTTFSSPDWVLTVENRLTHVPKKFKKRALITGITGQDGSYLAELLLSKDYAVHGIVRRASTNNLERIRHIAHRIILHEGDITDSNFVAHTIMEDDFDEIYNLAAQSHVYTSFSVPNYTFQVNTLGFLNILEAVRQYSDQSKIYQASTSEMFGDSIPPQGLDSDFLPVSPYAVSKLASHDLVRMYRDTYDLYAISGILFNHESPRRGENFVTRKITKYFGTSMKEKLRLGNIETVRDWGFAPDYISFIHQAMQEDKPTDFVLGTGISHSVKDFLDLVGNYLDVDWRKFVERDTDENVRPADINYLQADTRFVPYTNLENLVRIMVDYDNKDEPGKGKQYFMDTYGDTFFWRT